MKKTSLQPHVPQSSDRPPNSGPNDPTRNRSTLSGVFASSLFAAFLCLSGCGEHSATGEIGSPKEMGEKLNVSVPKGTPINTARDFMLKEGFSCDPKLDAKWKNKHHVNYLHCKREDGLPPIKRLWEVAVIHDGTSVLVVDVRAALVYP